MAEIGPQITFQDNTATNDRGITLELRNPVSDSPWVTSPVIEMDYSLMSYDPDDLTGEKRFPDFAREVFTLLDQCLIPKIHQTVYEAATQTADSLRMSDWHTCNTSHCRAGWVTTLTGKAGRELERIFGPGAAAELIYAQNGYHIAGYARFLDSNDQQALEDMKTLADLEARGLAPAEDELLNRNLDRR